MPAPVLVDGFSALAPGYDAVLCDVWGVVHNGVAALAPAGEALTRFRDAGGTVLLVSNAPRPGAAVTRLLDRFGVPRSAYDDIITSGDLTREFVASHPSRCVYHVGPERDRGIFAGLELRFGPAEAADYVICTGLFDDERETPEDYRGMLQRMRARGLLFLCANPDLVVERGDRLIYCAGAIADLYAQLGGEVVYAGKPHRPIYDAALARIAAARGAPIPAARVLAIGDSIRTDLAGAAALGIDGIFITRGIHAEELGHRDDPDLDRLGRFFAAAGVTPKAVMRQLAW
ncbi:MAG TPA: TIGR01459 family HAD-type hydrolase [Xanthobacteraceae bacterium]